MHSSSQPLMSERMSRRSPRLLNACLGAAKPRLLQMSGAGRTEGCSAALTPLLECERERPPYLSLYDAELHILSTPPPQLMGADLTCCSKTQSCDSTQTLMPPTAASTTTINESESNPPICPTKIMRTLGSDPNQQC